MDLEMKVICANPYSTEFIEFSIVSVSRISKQLYILNAFTKDVILQGITLRREPFCCT